MGNDRSADVRGFRRLSGNDAIFIYAETASMPMHTMGTLILDPSDCTGGFGYDDVVRTFRERIHLIPPFRMRLLEVPFDLGHPVLVDDPEFAIENHIRRIGAPSPGGPRELALVVGTIAEHPLERTKPLWEMWVVDGLADGRLALVTKLHHCVMDGASGSAQMAGLLDLEPDAVPAAPEPWDPPPLPTPLELARRCAFDRVIGPRRAARFIFDAAGGLRRRLRVERKIERRDGERPAWIGPRTPFNRSLTPHRSVAYGSVDLEDLKRVKRAFGITVNDAVLGACTLAIRNYLRRLDALPEVPLHCSMPVSLKNKTEREEFSNKLTAVTVDLPTQLDDPAAILEAVHRGTANAKEVLSAVEVDIMPELLDLLPGIVAQLGVRLVSDSKLLDYVPPMFNLVLSNVTGPPVPLYFGGARVEKVYPMGPVGEGMGLNITVLSNMGRLDIGIMACTEAVPDPWQIADAFRWAVGELVVAAEKREAERAQGTGPHVQSEPQSGRRDWETLATP
jgi:WS/DGAT/MGAT family acyltransferase